MYSRLDGRTGVLPASCHLTWIASGATFRFSPNLDTEYRGSDCPDFPFNEMAGRVASVSYLRNEFAR